MFFHLCSLIWNGLVLTLIYKGKESSGIIYWFIICKTVYCRCQAPGFVSVCMCEYMECFCKLFSKWKKRRKEGGRGGEGRQGVLNTEEQCATTASGALALGTPWDTPEPDPPTNSLGCPRPSETVLACCQHRPLTQWDLPVFRPLKVLCDVPCILPFLMAAAAPSITAPAFQGQSVLIPMDPTSADSPNHGSKMWEGNSWQFQKSKLEFAAGQQLLTEHFQGVRYYKSSRDDESIQEGVHRWQANPTPSYTRDLSVLRCWYPWRVLWPILRYLRMTAASWSPSLSLSPQSCALGPY